MNPRPCSWDNLPASTAWPSFVDMAQVFTGVATAAIAAIVAIIAFRQFRVERLKLQHELFERRFDVYKTVQAVLSNIMTHAKPEDEDFPRLLDALQRARFLFDDEVPHKLKAIYDCTVRLKSLEGLIYVEQQDTQRSQLVKEQSEKLRWVGEQLDGLHEIFYPYLRFRMKTPSRWLPRLSSSKT